MILSFRVGTSKNKNTDHWVEGTCAIISIHVTYETDFNAKQLKKGLNKEKG